MTDLEFEKYCDGFEHLCAGILKLINSTTSIGYDGEKKCLIFDRKVNESMVDLVNAAKDVGMKLCEGFHEQPVGDPVIGDE